MSFQPFGARAGHRSGRHFFGDKSPAPRAREPFKPSTDLESLLVSVDKFFFDLWLKTLFLTNIKKFHKRYNLPFQAKLWPAIPRQQMS